MGGLPRLCIREPQRVGFDPIRTPDQFDQGKDANLGREGSPCCLPCHTTLETSEKNEENEEKDERARFPFPIVSLILGTRPSGDHQVRGNPSDGRVPEIIVSLSFVTTLLRSRKNPSLLGPYSEGHVFWWFCGPN